jgi:DeoR family L-fucose operon activator
MKAARQQAIVDLLINHSSLTTEALSKQLNVSKETIRRDLSELQAQGKCCVTTVGQKSFIAQPGQRRPFPYALKSHYAHKADIAREALAWIDEGMVIALDASSTCWYLARQLPDIPCTSLPTASPSARSWQTRTDSAHLLRRHAPAEIWLLRQPGADLPAEIAGDRSVYFFLRRHRQHGALWDSNAVNADFKSLLLKRAAQSLLLIDKSKFNRSGRRGLVIWMM